MSIAPLIVAATLAARDRSKPRRPFWIGFLAGVIYFVGTLYWIGDVMATYGNISPVVAYLLMFGLSMQLGLFVGAFAQTLARGVRRFGMGGVWLAPPLWVAFEWLRIWLGWNFPWVQLGSSQAGVVPVVQLASVTGTYGLSALLALTGTAAAALALSRRAPHVRGAIAVGLTVATVVGWGTWRASRSDLTQLGEPIKVGLLQGNVSLEERAREGTKDVILERYINLSRQALGSGAQLVLWPEASAPFYFNFDAASAAPVRRLAAESRVPFVVGSDDLDFDEQGRPARYYNAAMLVGPDGQTRATYRKVVLVPFGEYVPFKSLLFFVGPLVENVGDFLPGKALEVFDVEGTRFSVAICYEAVYASVARTFVADGSELLTTITNDAWFNTTSAAYQHFDQAALRAVEQGRYLVRAANTGISGAVDPYGRVLARSPLFETTALTVDVRLLTGHTIYHAIGDVVAWASLVLAGVVLWMARRPKDTQA